MKFPGEKDFKPFDPKDPNEVLSEAVRKAIVSAMKPLVLASETPEDVQAIMVGAVVGLVGTAFCCCTVEDHRTMLQNISDALPPAATHARMMMGLPALKDS